MGFNSVVDQSVQTLAKLAFECGIDGVVCSAHEVTALKSAISSKLITVTPGIRLANDVQDQQRVMTPQAALLAGADHLVMGRAITAATNPVDVLRGIYLG